MDKDPENQNDELENKISEAEMEAQQAPPAEDPADAPFEKPPAETAPASQPPEKQGLSRARKIWRRILVWLVVIAVFFAGGFYLDTYLRYVPAQEQIARLEAQKADQTDQISSLKADQAAQISDLQAEIDRLSQFEEQNVSLNEQIDQLKIHLQLLSARAAVADAALAFEQQRISDASLALDTLGTSLESLKGMLSGEQAGVVDSMLQRYDLVISEMGNEDYQVGTDLDLLANRLVVLENNLFAAP